MTFIALRRVRRLSCFSAALLVAGAVTAQEKTGTKFQVPESLYDAPAVPPAQQPVFQPRPDTVLATVDGAPIVAAELGREMQGLAQMLSRQYSQEQLQGMVEQIRNQAMSNLVARKLLLAEAVRSKVSVQSTPIDEAIANIEKQIPPGSTLDAELSKQGGNRTALRMEIENQLKINQLLEKNVPKPALPTQGEIETFYKANPKQFEAPETVNVRHVLIKTEAADSEAVKQKKKSDAQTLQKALSKGGDFAEIARTRSDCPSKERGGDLGTVARGQMVPEFEKAAFSQEVGKVGDVVETKFGYHILRVEAKNPARTVPMDEAKAKISDFLTRQSQEKAVAEYVTKLQGAAKIEFPKPQG
jgi:parvulin-like peptidyl-prolyl isomerase